MSNDLVTGTVCILNSTDAIVGISFIVTNENLIATCAHVAESDSDVCGTFHKTGTRQQAESQGNKETRRRK